MTLAFKIWDISDLPLIGFLKPVRYEMPKRGCSTTLFWFKSGLLHKRLNMVFKIKAIKMLLGWLLRKPLLEITQPFEIQIFCRFFLATSVVFCCCDFLDLLLENVFLICITVFPHIVSFLNLEIVANSNSCRNISIFYLINWIFGTETIQGRKLFKGGNYMRKYSTCFSVILQ